MCVWHSGRYSARRFKSVEVQWNVAVQIPSTCTVEGASLEMRTLTSTSMEMFVSLALLASFALGFPGTLLPCNPSAIDFSSAGAVSPASDFTAQSSGYAHGYCNCTFSFRILCFVATQPLLADPPTQSPSSSCNNASPRPPSPGTPRPWVTSSASKTPAASRSCGTRLARAASTACSSG
jgi:hypothetical protein